MHTERLGRFGPSLSTVGLRWRGDRDPNGLALSRAAVVGIDWVLLDAREVGRTDRVAVPAGWSIVLVGTDAPEVRRALEALGRAAVDVVLARDESSWAAAVSLVDQGRARCAGLVTDNAEAVERSRHHRHVDAVLASIRPDPALVRVCRWSGTGVLVGAGRIAVHHPSPTIVAATAAD